MLRDRGQVSFSSCKHCQRLSRKAVNVLDARIAQFDRRIEPPPAVDPLSGVMSRRRGRGDLQLAGRSERPQSFN